MKQKEFMEILYTIRGFRNQEENRLSSNDLVNRIYNAVVADVLKDAKIANGIKYRIDQFGRLMFEPGMSYQLITNERENIDYDSIGIIMARSQNEYNTERERLIKNGKLKHSDNLHSRNMSDGTIQYGTIEAFMQLGSEEEKIKRRRKDRMRNVPPQEMYMFLCSVQGASKRTEEEVWAMLKNWYSDDKLFSIERIMKDIEQPKEF